LASKIDNLLITVNVTLLNAYEKGYNPNLANCAAYLYNVGIIGNEE